MKFPRIAVLVAALCASTSVSAAVTTYTDLASFAAASGPLQIETLNSFTVETSFQLTPITLGGGAFQVRGFEDFDGRHYIDVPPAQFTVFDIDGTPNINALVVGQDGMKFFFASPITSFGFDAAALQDRLGTAIEAADTQMIPPLQPGDTISFFGFVSTTPFTTIKFLSVGPRLTDGFSIDNIRWSPATISAVPELSTWAMLIVGFGLVGVASRRRRVLAA